MFSFVIMEQMGLEIQVFGIEKSKQTICNQRALSFIHSLTLTHSLTHSLARSLAHSGFEDKILGFIN